MKDWVLDALGASFYAQHAICLSNDALMVAMYTAGHLGTFMAYFIIGLTLIVNRVHMVRMSPTALALYGAFIFLCGLNHLTKVLTLYWGVYRLDIIVVFAMAAVSMATAALTVAAVYGGTREAEARQ